jgi:hypothetical protein
MHTLGFTKMVIYNQGLTKIGVNHIGSDSLRDCLKLYKMRYSGLGIITRG